MRILASADHHFDEHSPRWCECLRVHDWMVDLARDEHVDLFLSAGDIYERASTPLERQAVAEWLTKTAEVCPVVIAKGNHDRPNDCELLGRLRSRHSIIVEEQAAMHCVAGAAIATVAWPDRGVLLAQMKGSEETNLSMREALQDLLRGFGGEFEHHDGPRILLGHFMIDGSITSTGQPLLGQPINVGLSDLALSGAALGVIGHVHRAQSFVACRPGPMYSAGCGPDGPNDIEQELAPYHYAGSPYRTDFGQTEPKTVMLAEFDGQRLVSLQEIHTPCARMEHIELWWSPELANFVPQQGLCFAFLPVFEDLSNSEVRLRYHVQTDQREAAERRANEIADSMRSAGAVLVKVDPQVMVERRARAPEVARASSIADKLAAYWASIGFDPGDRRESILTKAISIEEQARHDA